LLLAAALDFDDFAFGVHFGFGKLGADVGDEGAAGADAGGGLCPRLAGQARFDFVADREFAGTDGGELPDGFDGLAWLEGAEGVGLRVRGLGAARGGGSALAGSWTAKGIWAASPSLPSTLTVMVRAGTVFLPVFSTSTFISEVWPMDCFAGKLAPVTFTS
jgi:hypothetical protein